MVESKPLVLEKAPPPVHSVLLVATMFALFTCSLPSFESIDERATVEAFTSTHFDWMSTLTLSYFRLSFALVGMVTTAYYLLFAEIQVLPAYKKHSKLKRPKCWVLTGISTHMFFTQWAWLLLWISFALSGSIAYMAANGHADYVRRNCWLLRAGLLTFEAAAPIEFLVAAVVKYILWPRQLAAGRPTFGLRKKSTLIVHNTCVFMILLEVAILGNIPFELSHISVAPLFGVMYILFAWYVSDKCCPKDGPQFLYFFLDTTLGKESTISLLALLIVLMTFYFMFWLADDVMIHIPGVSGRIAAIGVLSSSLCRFRD